ncbi:MAG: ABC transporter ATP-binding protein [Chloroflexi bacterium]|nr:ABC transporter ATP-binding protein [Chloroflexota bacterium]
MTIVTLTNITKEYISGKLILSNLNLQINEGELVALLGPSGSGKTTVLRLIAGLLEPTQGDVAFNDRSMRSVPPEKRGAAMVFQNHAIFPFMSVGENIAFGLKVKHLSKKEISKRVAESLQAVQLPGFEYRHPATLSGGQRQRVALARALVVRPNVLLLDEPLSNLETVLRVELGDMIRTVQKETGITTLFVTHDQSEAFTIADRVALLLDGSLRQIGSPQSFFEQPVDTDVVQFFGGSNIIQGIKRGNRVRTRIGELQVSQSDWPDGEVLLIIHPEAIEIGANGHNNFSAQITSQKYRGTRIMYEFLIKGQNLSVSVLPYQHCEEGAKMEIHVPKECIHLVPYQNKEKEKNETNQ